MAECNCTAEQFFSTNTGAAINFWLWLQSKAKCSLSNVNCWNMWALFDSILPHIKNRDVYTHCCVGIHCTVNKSAWWRAILTLFHSNLQPDKLRTRQLLTSRPQYKTTQFHGMINILHFWCICGICGFQHDLLSSGRSLYRPAAYSQFCVESNFLDIPIVRQSYKE